MGARTLQTFEQFEQFPDDGMKHELLKREHIVAPPPKFRHSSVQHKLFHSLWPYVHQRDLGDVRIETGYKLSPDSWLQPDVSFLRSSQILATDPNGYLEGAPAVAIEVVSESNTDAKLKLKLQLYFAHGSEEVWIVDPKMREVRVQRPDGTITNFAAGELRSDLFHGWAIQVGMLFDV